MLLYNGGVQIRMKSEVIRLLSDPCPKTTNYQLLKLFSNTEAKTADDWL